MQWPELRQTQLLTPQEVADVLKLGKSTIYQMVKRGELPHILINHSVRIPANALTKWIEERINLPDEEEKDQVHQGSLRPR
jgi:putative molybdopterin biosynthesis protein